MDKLKYKGEFLKKRNDQLDLDAYAPSEELKEAVNLAIFLERPLLLMGEPGSGKTRLAEAVAAEFHKEKWNEYFFRWDIKSTSKAREGIYQYDALGRLYDAGNKEAKAQRIRNYISFGKFAQALTKPQNGNLPNILLIDEIDKADIDFPNDLLLEIEKGKFYIPELDQTILKSSKLIIFITSNRERELPAAFLRRCLYHFINFPTQEHLIKMINAKFNKPEKDPLVTNAVNLFLEVRARLEAQFAESEKKPATSELLEWFHVINQYQEPDYQPLLTENERLFIDIVKNFEKGKPDRLLIPFPQVLLKTFESNQLFEIK